MTGSTHRERAAGVRRGGVGRRDGSTCSVSIARRPAGHDDAVLSAIRPGRYRPSLIAWHGRRGASDTDPRHRNLGRPVPEALRQDLEAFLVREVKEPPGLRNGRRQTAHVAEFAADPFHKLLIGGTLRRRPRERSHAKRPDRNVKAGMREGKWLVRGGRHDANAPEGNDTPVAAREQ